MTMRAATITTLMIAIRTIIALMTTHATTSATVSTTMMMIT
jgi:hypothetical protein